MENRRQHYRHALAGPQRLRAQFRSAATSESFAAEIVDLSIGGMCAVPETKELTTAGRWRVVFALAAKKMQVMVESVHSSEDRSGHCGFRILPSAEIKQRENQERAIWQFLLEEQRREQRRSREKRLTG
jgi:PilZ domain